MIGHKEHKEHKVTEAQQRSLWSLRSNLDHTRSIDVATMTDSQQVDFVPGQDEPVENPPVADSQLVFGAALYSFDKIGLTTAKYTRASHLIGGAIMVALGLIMLFRPSLLIFG